MNDAPSGLEKYRRDLRSRKRADILSAATDAFVQDGYDRATVEQIAKAASVSLATLYKHFPTKEALYGAALEASVARLTAQAEPVPGDMAPRAALIRLGRAYAALLLDETTLGFLRSVIAEQPRFPVLGAQLYERGKTAAHAPVHAYLAAASTRGVLDLSGAGDPAGLFHGMIEHATLLPALLAGPEAAAHRDLDSIARDAAETFLGRFGV